MGTTLKGEVWAERVSHELGPSGPLTSWGPPHAESCRGHPRGPWDPQPAPRRPSCRERCSHTQHSLVLDLIGRSPSDLLRVGLGFAPVPQVDEGFVDVENDHGRPRPEAAAVTGHLQQVPLHGHLSAHTVQPPLACRGRQRHS